MRLSISAYFEPIVVDIVFKINHYIKNVLFNLKFNYYKKGIKVVLLTLNFIYELRDVSWILKLESMKFKNLLICAKISSDTLSRLL